MKNFSTAFIRFNWIALVLIYLVVIAGSFVRITGSGMGCPDWPKCFGQWVPPTQKAQLPIDYKDIYAQKRAEKIEKFANFLGKIGFKDVSQKIKEDKSLLVEQNFNAKKTWTEYANRLVGFLAGNALLVAFIWILVYYRRRDLVLLAGFNLIFLGFEAWFGSIVVATNLVPWTITVHLFFALVIIGIQLIIIRKISVKQSQNLYIEPTLKWLIIFCFIITFIQMFLGTQVREYIDELTKQGFGRETWSDKLGIAFLIHRSFSWLVLIILLFITWKNESSQKLPILRTSFIVLALELISGVLLAYANMPGLVQTSHLVFATILLGTLGMAVLRVRSTSIEAVK
jgi:cytochrome c oxidase assembly protein subunit 15